MWSQVAITHHEKVNLMMRFYLKSVKFAPLSSRQKPDQHSAAGDQINADEKIN